MRPESKDGDQREGRDNNRKDDYAHIGAAQRIGIELRPPREPPRFLGRPPLTRSALHLIPSPASRPLETTAHRAAAAGQLQYLVRRRPRVRELVSPADRDSVPADRGGYTAEQG